jgi:hypothetical protein
MRTIITLFALMFLSAEAGADPFVVSSNYEVIARRLQTRLPNFAADKLIEAKRGSAEWRYSFYTRIEKTWVEEVQVSVRQESADTTRIDVEVVRIEGGLLKTKAVPLPASTKEWSAKIGDVIKE